MKKLSNLSFRLPLAWAYLLMLAISIILSLLLFLIQPNTGTNYFSLITESHGITFLLNWLPVALVMLLGFFATGRVVAAVGISALVFALPSVVNRYMVAMRYAPLQPMDLLLGAEFLGIAKSIRPLVYITAAAGVIVGVVLLVFAFKIIQNDKPGTVTRAIGAAASLGLAVTLYFTAYASADVHSRLPLQGNQYSETDQFQSKGFVYSFIHSLHTNKLTKPSFYEEYKTLITEAEKTSESSARDEESLPNIIIVQSEAFSELTLSDAVNFDGFTDPLKNYKEVKEESVHGYVVAPHLGGGTSDMEFDVLTGLNTRNFRGVPYAFKMINKPFPSVASVLKRQGYATVAMHPGAGWFYNRQNVYPMMGFDKFMDDQFYDTADTKGMYITERQTIDKLMDEFETHEEPLFLFCITIQNHGPYYGKYALDKLNFNAGIEIPEEDAMAFANYAEGVTDGDEGLRRLVEHFSNSGEPTVLVYYGDHLPSFPVELLETLDPLPADAPPGEQMLKYNRMPFLIWTNEAAKPLTGTAAFEASLPEDKTISSYYFGAALLEMAGITGDPFFDYVNSLRADYPIVMEQTYRPAAPPMLRFDPERDSALAKYQSWAYHRVTE